MTQCTLLTSESLHFDHSTVYCPAPVARTGTPDAATRQPTTPRCAARAQLAAARLGGLQHKFDRGKDGDPEHDHLAGVQRLAGQRARALAHPPHQAAHRCRRGARRSAQALPWAMSRTVHPVTKHLPPRPTQDEQERHRTAGGSGAGRARGRTKYAAAGRHECDRGLQRQLGPGVQRRGAQVHARQPALAHHLRRRPRPGSAPAPGQRMAVTSVAPAARLLCAAARGPPLQHAERERLPCNALQTLKLTACSAQGRAGPQGPAMKRTCSLSCTPSSSSRPPATAAAATPPASSSGLNSPRLPTQPAAAFAHSA
jgi:hypothetical protein